MACPPLKVQHVAGVILPEPLMTQVQPEHVAPSSKKNAAPGQGSTEGPGPHPALGHHFWVPPLQEPLHTSRGPDSSLHLEGRSGVPVGRVGSPRGKVGGWGQLGGANLRPSDGIL